MTKKLRLPRYESMPINSSVKIGDLVGSGKDNLVYDLIKLSPGEVDPEQLGMVLKVNHPYFGQTSPDGTHNIERAKSRIRYKKEKYELLKTFLGEFIPRTDFVLATVEMRRAKRIAEYTFQEQIPQYKLSDLSPGQKADPRLLHNMESLLIRLRYMYRTLGEVNARMGSGIVLDGKLDLGGVSDYAVAQDFDYEFGPNDASRVINTNTSPNLLVNPDTMMLYCIDFDEGLWTDGMSRAKQLAEQLIKRDTKRQKALGDGALQNAGIRHPF